MKLAERMVSRVGMKSMIRGLSVMGIQKIEEEIQNVRGGAELGGTTLPELDTVQPLGRPG